MFLVFYNSLSHTNSTAAVFRGLPLLGFYKAFDLVFTETTLWHSYLIAFTWYLDIINAEEMHLVQKGFRRNTAYPL